MEKNHKNASEAVETLCPEICTYLSKIVGCRVPEKNRELAGAVAAGGCQALCQSEALNDTLTDCIVLVKDNLRVIPRVRLHQEIDRIDPGSPRWGLSSGDQQTPAS